MSIILKNFILYTILCFILTYLSINANTSINESIESKIPPIDLNEKASPEENSPPQIEKTKPKLESLNFSSPLNDKFVLKKRFSKNPLKPHRGILLKTENSALIYPTLEGKIVSIDTIEGLETVLIIDHGNNIFSVYGHLARVFVTEGEFVSKNKSLGSLQKLKNLYFQINSGSKTYDPSLLVKF